MVSEDISEEAQLLVSRICRGYTGSELQHPTDLIVVEKSDGTSEEVPFEGLYDLLDIAEALPIYSTDLLPLHMSMIGSLMASTAVRGGHFRRGGTFPRAGKCDAGYIGEASEQFQQKYEEGACC